MFSKSCVSVMLLASTLLLVALPARAEERPGQLAHDLSFSLSVSIVAVCVVIMLIVGIVLLHRAKKGHFCCLKPRIIYPVVQRKRTSRAVRKNDPEEPQVPAPSYEVHPRGANIAPPDYEDALQDVVVQPAEPQEQAETTIADNVSLDDTDDRTPLNP
ncbi:uncharacterized protein LOC135342936 [Halichondria panicea]|uniref:uncharacterized protein LOC135342936 n=1 Tax=Halichondria panicea TaxID=6063 RepID=UPI00312BB52E